MNKKSIFILIILAIFLIGLLLWENWPGRIEIIHLGFNKNQTNQIQSINCRTVDLLLNRQWEIRYPYSISKFGTKTISVVLSDSSLTSSSIISGESECDIAIEVLLDVSGIITIPGSRMIEPYHLGAPLRFEWGVEAVNDEVSGTIWIYILVDENGGQYSRYPIFSLPLEIRSISLMDIPPHMVRIILFALGLIISGIYLLLKTNR